MSMQEHTLGPNKHTHCPIPDLQCKLITGQILTPVHEPISTRTQAHHHPERHLMHGLLIVTSGSSVRTGPQINPLRNHNTWMLKWRCPKQKGNNDCCDLFVTKTYGLWKYGRLICLSSARIFRARSANRNWKKPIPLLKLVQSVRAKRNQPVSLFAH